MGAIASQITSLAIVYSTVYSDADQRKHQSSASLAFVWGIHRGPVNSPHKWPVTRKMFQFDDVIMLQHEVLWYTYFFQTDNCAMQFAVTLKWMAKLFATCTVKISILSRRNHVERTYTYCIFANKIILLCFFLFSTPPDIWIPLHWPAELMGMVD